MGFKVNLFICALINLGDSVLSKYCYWNSPCQYKLFSTKTVYDDVRGDLRDVSRIKGCTPLSIWLLSRHGSRHPGKNDTDNMKNVAKMKIDIIDSYINGKGHLCAQDIEDLSQWEWDESLDNTSYYLTDIGYDELVGLGRRLRQKFSNIWEDERENSYYFRPTREQRTMKSAEAFVYGLSDDSNMTFVVDETRDMDAVVRPYHKCESYQKSRDIFETTRVRDEIIKFYDTPEYNNLLENVRKRTGIEYNLSPENITALYNLCRYYRALSDTRKSPWCSIFTKQDLISLEYVNDIQDYYRNAYGVDINKKLGAMPMKDLYEVFAAARNGSGRIMTGYFSHDSLIQMVYSAMGLYKDEQAISGEQRTLDRKWRTSLMSSFAANIIAVLYRCESKEKKISHKVQFFINEEEVLMCGARRTCEWEEFEEKFAMFVEANLDFCNNNIDIRNM